MLPRYLDFYIPYANCGSAIYTPKRSQKKRRKLKRRSNNAK